MGSTNTAATSFSLSNHVLQVVCAGNVTPRIFVFDRTGVTVDFGSKDNVLAFGSWLGRPPPGSPVSAIDVAVEP